MGPNLKYGKVTLRCGPLTFRWLHSRSKSRPTLVGIPGGPAIDGRYIDGFLERIASRLGWNLVVFDLPFHDPRSRKIPSESVDYNHIVASLAEALERLHCKQVVLVGHSFGAHLGLDLASTSLVGQIRAVVAISLAGANGASTQFRQRLRKLNVDFNEVDSDHAFKLHWRRSLPVFFHRPMDRKLYGSLSKRTFWRSSRKMQEGKPDPYQSLSKLQRTQKIPVLTLNGEKDLRLPDGNDELLPSSSGNWKNVKIPESGHFPMIETPRSVIREIIAFIDSHPWVC